MCLQWQLIKERQELNNSPLRTQCSGISTAVISAINLVLPCTLLNRILIDTTCSEDTYEAAYFLMVLSIVSNQTLRQPGVLVLHLLVKYSVYAVVNEKWNITQIPAM
jgi:hypothetical protein